MNDAFPAGQFSGYSTPTGYGTPQTRKLHYGFRGLASARTLGWGANAIVYEISPRVAFKSPKDFEPPLDSWSEQMIKYGKERVNNEMNFLKWMAGEPSRHPNFVQSILVVPEGIFMEKLGGTLASRLQKADEGRIFIPQDIKYKWISQLASVLAWLESLGWAHGDNRPENILLDEANDDIRLCDFDSCGKIGEDSVTGADPFIKYGPNREWPLAGAENEQWAFGCIVYYILNERLPYYGLEEDSRERRIRGREYPKTEENPDFEEIMQACFAGKFDTMGDMNKAVHARLEEIGAKLPPPREMLSDAALNELRRECETFMNSNRIPRLPIKRSHTTR